MTHIIMPDVTATCTCCGAMYGDVHFEADQASVSCNCGGSAIDRSGTVRVTLTPAVMRMAEPRHITALLAYYR